MSSLGEGGDQGQVGVCRAGRLTVRTLDRQTELLTVRA